MTILTSADFPRVRSVIDTTLGTDDVSDATIAMDEFQAEGEARVYERLPQAATLVGLDAARVKTAAILFVAALVAESLPRITQEFVGRRSYGATKAAATADMLSIAANLRARAEMALANVTAVPLAEIRPVMFALARGTRGA